MTTTTQARPARRPGRWDIVGYFRRRPYLAFIVPTVAYVLSLTLYPALYSIFISFTNLNFGYVDWKFVGLDNYARLLRWEFLPLVLGNTAVFVIGVSAIQIVLGFCIALILNQRLPLRRTVRTIAVLPWIVPSIVIALLFQQIFNGSRLGIANTIVNSFGAEGQMWLSNPPVAMAIMIGALVWRGLPLTIIILLGGLQTIPRDIYEASVVDGATPRQVALAFLTRRESVFAIPKASSAEHAADNAAAGDLTLTAAEIARIEEAFPLGRPRGLPMI